jgi:hypothetical protein
MFSNSFYLASLKTGESSELTILLPLLKFLRLIFGPELPLSEAPAPVTREDLFLRVSTLTVDESFELIDRAPTDVASLDFFLLLV